MYRRAALKGGQTGEGGVGKGQTDSGDGVSLQK